jgi:iron complex outermembrane receptor protein
LDRFTLALGARNLFDKQYFTTKTLSSASAAVYGTLARPREVYAQFTYRFGS